MPHFIPVLAFCLLALTACGDEPDLPTSSQNAQLDEAEAMLDEASGEKKGPDAEAPDPSEITD